MISRPSECGQDSAGNSVLEAIPSPDVIRDRMTNNAAENRILRSLYRLAKRIESYRRQAAQDRKGSAQ